MNKSFEKKGFVLVVILAVLVIASVVMGSWAYRSGSEALRAGEYSRDIQRKWANLSCQKFLISGFDDFFDPAESDLDQPSVSVDMEIKLSGMEYNLKISDEQAKANINSLFSTGDGELAATSINSLLSDIENPPKMLAIKNAKKISSFDEVFDYENPDQLMGLERLTCWGSGLLNYMRADKETLSVVTAGVLSETDVQKILDLRANGFEGNLAALCQQLELKDFQIAALKKILTDSSGCRSVWIKCQSDVRSWHRLYVEQTEEGSSRVLVYEW